MSERERAETALSGGGKGSAAWLSEVKRPFWALQQRGSEEAT
ncbi:hypothetical protein [Paenibacillus sp. SI8]